MPEKKDTAAKKTTKKKTVKKTAKSAGAAAEKKATKTAVKKTAAKKKSTAAKPADDATPAATTKPVAKKAKAAPAARLRIKQVRSTIHRPKTFKRTLVALGLKHHQDEVVVTDSPSTRGMLHKVRHLINVTPEES